MTAVLLYQCVARAFIHSFNKLFGAFYARPGKGGTCWAMERSPWATDMVLALVVLKVFRGRPVGYASTMCDAEEMVISVK